MKSIYYLLQRATLVLLACCCYAITFAQITVTPPAAPDSYVYLAGTGGTLGSIPTSSGTVGEEGIVGMSLADANSYFQGSFTVNFSSGTQSVIGWSVEGDLVIVSGATSNTVVIANDNENIRSAPTDKAQSKGRVTLEYLDTSIPIGCPGQNRYFVFDIFKTYNSTTTVASVDPIPPIVGPSCVGPNQQVTYSADPIASDNLADEIGVDRYFWTVTGDHTVDYYSTDSSSITFTTGPSYSGGTVTCCFGLCNYYNIGLTTPTGDTSICSTFDVSPTPDEPVITLSQNCLDIGATTDITASITPQTGYTYNWTMPSNPDWDVFGSPGSSVTITPSTLDNNPGIIVLTTSGCQGRVDYDTIERNFIAPLSLVGNASCVTPGSSVNISLSSGNQNNTCWNVPMGWDPPTNITPTGSSVNVQVPATAGPGAYAIEAYSCACSDSVLTYTINVKPNSVSIDSDPDPACFFPGGSAVEFTAALSPSASSGVYSWGTLTGWTGSSGTDALVYTPGASAVGGDMTLTVCADTGVCCVIATPLTVNRQVLVTGITPNRTCVNIGVAGTISLTASVIPATGVTFAWSVPAGLGTAVDATTNPLVINTLASITPATYQVSLTASNGCAPMVATYDVVVGSPTLSILESLSSPSGADFYQVSPFGAGVSYVWRKTTVANPTPTVVGGNSFFLVLSSDSSTSLTSLCCDVTFSNGCIERVCADTVGKWTAAKGAPDTFIKHQDQLEGLDLARIRPNPNSGSFVISPPVFERTATVSIHSATGELVLQRDLKPGENVFDEKQLAAGVYILIFNTDGKIQTERIVINK